VRPIITEDPLMNYTGHAISVEFKSQIRDICGEEQLMGVSAGCEILAHTVRCMIESDHAMVIGKVDGKNAYNSIYAEPILQTIEEEVPTLLPFFQMIMTGKPLEMFFTIGGEESLWLRKCTEAYHKGERPAKPHTASDRQK
jgi:hypothetical protein